MGRIPEHVVAEVRGRADLVQTVGRVVSLSKRTGGRHWGLCPFHSEKTPSFQVHEERQIFHCFGCGVGGDVFSFRMRHEGLDFPDAVRAVAREVGVEIRESSGRPRGRVTRLYAVLDAARDYFRSALRGTEGAAARRYLEERRIPQDLQERFQLGFAPGRWDGLLRHLEDRGLAAELAEQAGLVAPRQSGDGFYDRFRGRVIFPILEPSGQVIGFGGRALEDGVPKYLNSPESPVYHKGRVLFGLPQALDPMRRTGRVIIVEGYFDLLALHRAGLAEGVAPCGTALTGDQARRLRRYTREIVLLFDGDEAGRNAAERALPVLLAEDLRVRAAFLPRGEDPDTLVSREGAESLRACVDSAAPLLDELINERLRGSASHAWAVSDAAQAVAPLLRSVADPLERAAYVRRVAIQLELPAPELQRAVEHGGGRVREEPASQTASRAPVDVVSRTLLAALASWPEILAEVEPPRPEWMARLDGEGRELLARLVEAVRIHGAGAVSHLLSPAGELPAPLQSTLGEIAAASGPQDREAARQAFQDCLTHLEEQALARESRSLTARIEASGDPAEQLELLEAKQRKLERLRTLRSVDQRPGTVQP